MRAASATLVDDEHDLVADHLDHPPAGAGHDVVGDLLEAPHDGGELLVAQVLAEEREADHVGEPHGEDRALPGARPWLRSIMLRWIPAATWRRHTNSSSLAMAGMVTSATLAKASAESDRVDLRAHHVPGHELGLGDAGHGRADDPGHLHRRLGVGRTERLEALEEADRLEVEVGEGGVVVVDAGEPERPPEALELVDGRRR